MKPFAIAGISFWPELWQPDKNLKTLVGHMREAAKQGARVVATPEGILDGYIARELDIKNLRPQHKGSKGYTKRLAEFKKRQSALADEIKEKHIPRLQEEAARCGTYLFANTLDHRGGQEVYNTTFVIDPKGKIIGKYDKIHTSTETATTPGKGYHVFKTPFAPIGVIICADRQYPEAPRSVALSGAAVLIINSYGMWGQGENERFIRQRAYENGIFILFCHPGETVLLSPEGRVIAATCAWENVLVRTIDPRQSIARGMFGNAEEAKTYLTDVKLYGRRQQKKKK